MAMCGSTGERLLDGSSSAAAAGQRTDSECGRTRALAVPPPQPSQAEGSTWTLEHRPEAAGHARQIVHSTLEGWRVFGEEAQAVLLVVSELVANAIQHAHPPLTLHLYRERVGQRLWVGITDGGPASPAPRAFAGQDDEHGRGLHIIDALTTAHGTHPHGEGATHWARMPATSVPDGQAA
ncbi:ATP-binding protein [Streptomyces sp. R11]|uniref:ATP-binding protein n=1 Tax=Streptomyces sp. R11 TaxID=3238625 RepID=A0AB39NDU3_9ACTN